MDITNSDKGVSVIICCYNSSAHIIQTLTHLEKQLVPDGFNWEIIIVDNASADDTITKAKDFREASAAINGVLRIVHESTPGQMHARKTGAYASKYECLVFCDDDNFLDEHYVFTASEVIFKDRTIGAAGGQNLPLTDANIYPGWFEEYASYYALGIPAGKTGDITDRGFVLGAGLITRRSVFLEVLQDKYPSLLNGRNGEQLTTGDDFEYCKRLLLWNYRLYYDERLKLRHFIPKERLTIGYRNRLMDGIMESRKILNKYDTIIALKDKLSKKNKLRLKLITPLRILLIRLGLSKRTLQQEQLVMAYLSPAPGKTDALKEAIIKFAKRL